jgi:hypothetical protein
MRLYDPLIQKVLTLVQGGASKELPLVSSWKEAKSKTFIFPEDSAVELGGDEPSSYLIAYTSSSLLVPQDSLTLVGADIPAIPAHSPFARIALVLLEDEKSEVSEQESYRILRDIEYRRYQVNPEGYVVRVNTNEIKEGGRLAKSALKAGFSFQDLGVLFLKQYHQDPHVKAVRQIFITDPAFPFAQLKELASLNEGITVTLDHILKTLKMDCRSCSFKSICDTVEGMREVHLSEQEHVKK